MNIYLNAKSYEYKNIKFNIPESNKKSIESSIINLILRVLELNNSSDMESIIDIHIPQNFISEITQFESEYNLSTYNTISQDYRVVAKCLKYEKNNVIKFALFYDFSLILPLLLFSEGISEYSYSLSLIEHELIHAIDIYKYSNNYKYFSKSETVNDYNKLLINKSIEYWKEYLANRAGHFHSEKNIKKDIDTLSKEILKYEETFKSIRKEYKFNGNLDLIINCLSSQIDYLLKRCIYQLGALNSLDNQNNLINYFKSKTQSSLIINILDDLSTTLETLYMNYSNLANDNFIPIKDIILKYWSLFGIYVENTEQGIYFSIPYNFDLFE